MLIVYDRPNTGTIELGVPLSSEVDDNHAKVLILGKFFDQVSCKYRLPDTGDAEQRCMVTDGFAL